MWCQVLRVVSALRDSSVVCAYLESFVFLKMFVKAPTNYTCRNLTDLREGFCEPLT